MYSTEFQSQTVQKQSHPEEFLQEFLSFIRSRLNVIGTSLYLLEESIKHDRKDGQKYVEKIYQEIDSIRKVINR